MPFFCAGRKTEAVTALILISLLYSHVILGGQFCRKQSLVTGGYKNDSVSKETMPTVESHSDK